MNQHNFHVADSNIRKCLRNRAHRLLYFFATTLTVASVSACSIADSTIYVANDTATRCDSQLGQYALPKSIIHVIINETEQGGKKYNVIDGLTQEQQPNNEMRYCFDYNPSPLSYDKIAAKTDNNGFISFVSSDAADQTAYIIKTIIRAVFVGISHNPNFRANEPQGKPPIKVADLMFDPFDIHETAAKNMRLVGLGFCLVLDGFTFRNNETAQSYCDNPKRYLSSKTPYLVGWNNFEVLCSLELQNAKGVDCT